jgi:hypothetical protein
MQLKILLEAFIMEGEIVTGKERERFEAFLEESFDNDIIVRELRLSADEKEYLLGRFPKAHLTRMPGNGFDDGKEWYEVKLFHQ